MPQIPTAIQPATLQQDLTTRAEDLQRRLQHAGKTPEASRHAMQEQVEEFASLLIFQMLQTMRQTIPRTGLLDNGMAHDMYMSFFDQEIARQMARRRDLGLTSLLDQQFNGLPDAKALPGQKQQAVAAYRQQQDAGFARLVSPVEGQLSSPFGWRSDPFEGTPQWHHGIDIAAPAGSLVRAVAPGQVVFNGARVGYGNTVVIAHHDGYQTHYAHTAENLVAVGTTVQRGQAIATVGQTGRSTGPHVHFEVRRHDQVLDPRPFLAETIPSPNK